MTLTSANESLTFSTNVWVIKIENKRHGKLTKDAFSSSLEITQFKNGIDKGVTLHLVWKDESLPNTCRFPTSSLSGEEYRAKIPFCYIKEFIHEHTSTTILSGGVRDAILACTFNDSHSLYIVSQKIMGEEDVISIPFNELDKYEFLMKFYSEKYNKNKKFRLNATSWNDVKLTWI